jgi:hypothetical protein
MHGRMGRGRVTTIRMERTVRATPTAMCSTDLDLLSQGQPV